MPPDALATAEPAVHRPASVNLRATGSADDTGPVLDPANQSLAETLGLVFRVLQVFMVGLLIAFVFSGLGQVKENERGVRLLFGRKTATDLEPGFRFSAPFPMGELVKVDRGSVSLDLDESFWPRLTEDQKSLPLEKLAGAPKASLKPGDDGSLLTGDQNIAHAQCSVHYHRERPDKYVQNILSDDERAIVQAMVERAIVQAVSQIKIDDLLNRAVAGMDPIGHRAQQIAQASLDEIDSGLQIDQLTLSQIAPPFLVLNDFFGVQSADQKARAAVEQAQSAARDRLNQMAGAAHEAIIAQIDEYERAVTRNDAQAGDAILKKIQDLFDGKPVEGDGKTIAAGTVTSLINDAYQYRSTIVRQREAELGSFRAKLAQFKTTPNLVIQREWADAMTAFLDRPYVEIFSVPTSAEAFELWLNRDPAIVKQMEQNDKEKRMALDKQRREAEMAEERFKTQTGAILKTR
jgi:membrane protease subunit HflK